MQMEMRHRTEEDALFRIFQKERERKSTEVQQQIDAEWQLELRRLTENFDEEMKRRNVPPEEQKKMTIRHQHERKNLEEYMTLKRDKVKRDVLKKMLEHERHLTTEMVDKHAEEMLELINKKKIEILAQHQELRKMQNMSLNDSMYSAQNANYSSIQVRTDYNHSSIQVRKIYKLLNTKLKSKLKLKH